VLVGPPIQNEAAAVEFTFDQSLYLCLLNALALNDFTASDACVEVLFCTLTHEPTRIRLQQVGIDERSLGRARKKIGGHPLQ
jgi:hypothetical protein